MVKSREVEQRILILGAGYFAEEVADLISRSARLPESRENVPLN